MTIPVLHFTNSVVRGGVEEHLLALLRGLPRDRFRLHFTCAPEIASALAAEIPADVEVIPLSLRRPTDVAAAYRFAQVLRSRRIGILHSHQFRASLMASPIGWLCRTPVIVETPHVREYWRRGFFTSRFVVDRVVGRCVDYYVANCRANARYLLEEKGLPARKMVLIYTGGDITRFDPDRSPSPALKAALGAGPDDPILLLLGRLAPQKGHRVMLEALPQVLREFPSARLVCVGDGALRPTLEADASRLGVAAAVKFVGHQRDTAEWLALADVTVLPSIYEGMPLAPIESLAAGRPVVATSVDGTPEIVIHGETGLTVPAGDAPALAAAVCRLLRDPELRRRLAAAGRRLVEERFNDDRLVRASADLYERAWTASASSRAYAESVA